MVKSILTWLVVALLGLLCATAAVAAATCVEWSPDGKSWHASTDAACAAMKSMPGYGNASTVITAKSEGVCKIMDSGMYIRDDQLQRREGKCANKCEAAAGQMSTINYTRGWARSGTKDKKDQVGATAEIPTSICQEGCKFGVLGNEEAYRSQTPSSHGLYRLSSDVLAVQTDQECTADKTTEAANPRTPDKACPGQLGDVNGVPTCVVPTGATGFAPNGPPSNEPEDRGNPTAGEKPGSGEGSGSGGVGRTPSQGNGGNMGGPAGAALGGSGTKPGTGNGNCTGDKCTGGDDDKDNTVGAVGEVTGGRKPAQPELYETKYPGGISAVWNESGLGGNQGKLSALAASFAPAIADSNGAPIVFRIPVGVGIYDFGTYEVSPPPMVWGFIRLCIIITALWLARALVFGG